MDSQRPRLWYWLSEQAASIPVPISRHLGFAAGGTWSKHQSTYLGRELLSLIEVRNCKNADLTILSTLSSPNLDRKGYEGIASGLNVDARGDLLTTPRPHRQTRQSYRSPFGKSHPSCKRTPPFCRPLLDRLHIYILSTYCSFVPSLEAANSSCSPMGDMGVDIVGDNTIAFAFNSLNIFSFCTESSPPDYERRLLLSLPAG